MHKTIGLDERVYAMLKEAKRPGESFSDVIERLLRPAGSWRDLVGILGPDGDAMADWLRRHRAAERERAREKWA